MLRNQSGVKLTPSNELFSNVLRAAPSWRQVQERALVRVAGGTQVHLGPDGETVHRGKD